MISFVLENRPHESTGVPMPTLVKKEEGKPDDEWCTVQDLDQLFEACVRRWGNNWNLEKIMVAITETQID